MNNIIFSESFRFVRLNFDKYHHTDNRKGSPQHYIAFMEEGSSKIVSDSNSIEIKKGDIFYIPMGLPYQSYWFGESDIRFNSYGFNFFPDTDGKSFCLQKIACPDSLKARVADIPIKMQMDCSALGEFYTVLSLLLPFMKTDKISNETLICRKAEKYMYENPKRTVCDIARHCNVSESTLYSAFKIAVGKTPNEIKQEILSQQATILLTTTDKSVQEISDTLDFSSTSYFRKILYKHTGKTPREIRKSSLSV